MDWMTIGEVQRHAMLPEGYELVRFERRDVHRVISALRTWFPGISVGAGSCFLRESFYDRRVVFEAEPATHDRDFSVMLLTYGNELVGMFSAQRDRDTLSLYGRMGAVAPTHRGQRLAEAVIGLVEVLGRHLGMGMAYGMATLHIPFMQRALEKHGFKLVGITPGYDREMVAPGVIKRVYEALYVKVLVEEEQLLRPDLENLTPGTRALFQTLFEPRHCSHG